MLLIYIVDKLFLLYTAMIFVRILGSWVPDLQGQKWMRFIVFYTDPYLNVFRRFIPPLGMFDFSPIVAFICLGFLQQIITTFLVRLLS